MSDNRFRIIGLHILPGCSYRIRKVLQEGETYLFTTDYERCTTVKDCFVKKCSVQGNHVEQTLYDVSTEDGVDVSIQMTAVVGKNGDGKSSLVELIIRILNNFAYATGFTSDQASLSHINGLCTILYYELGGELYRIKATDNIGVDGIEWYNGETNLLEPIKEIKERVERKQVLKENLQDAMFYSLIINYSLYAYNAKVLNPENEGNKPWIDALFHKNDSYQTPVVINPMRINGNIDVNKESYLSTQRLMALFTASGNREEGRTIGKEKIANAISMKLESESKFVKRTIFEYFVNNRGYNYAWVKIEQDLDERDGKLRGVRNIPECVEQLDTFLNQYARYADEYKELYGIIRSKEMRQPMEYEHVDESDLHKYARLCKDYIESANLQKEKYANTHRLLEWFLVCGCNWMNYAQLFRLILIIQVWGSLKSSYSDVFSGSLDNILSDRKENPISAAKLYVVYKIISVLETYRPYKDRSYIEDKNYSLITNGSESCFSELQADINTLLETEDYTTLKLHQTLNYLKHECKRCIIKPRSRIYPTGSGCVQVSFANLYKYISRYCQGMQVRNIISLLPPPIFQSEIVITKNGEQFTMADMSSGEIQLLNSVGSFIYHLRNIADEVTDDSKIKYNYVNVIMEEVELYFHPAYQKQYVNYLVEQIRRSGIKQVKGINICFVTHSPFILSDIRRSELLCLEDGSQKSSVGFPTFGANIHEMLRNPFFMTKGNVGDFAQRIINRIIVLLRLYEYRKHHKAYSYREFIETYKLEAKDIEIKMEDAGQADKLCAEFTPDKIHQMIMLIDEPIIRKTLEGEYLNLFPNNAVYDEETELLKKLKQLTGKDYVAS